MGRGQLVEIVSVGETDAYYRNEKQLVGKVGRFVVDSDGECPAKHKDGSCGGKFISGDEEFYFYCVFVTPHGR